jgi:methanogenic corrinoid protein MtbC1
MFNSTQQAATLDVDAHKAARTALHVQSRKLSEAELAVLAAEVLRRLALVASANDGELKVPGDHEIDAFCRVLLQDKETDSIDFVEQLRVKGATLDTIYLGYIAGAARRLGEQWDADAISFFDVTMAAGHMYAIMRGLRRLIAQPNPLSSRHAFFAAVPGETHTLGVTMAADLFQKRGWFVDLEFGKGHDELVDELAYTNHTIIGLSASRPDQIGPLVRLIVALRIVKPNAFIMISGQIVDAEPEIAKAVDADCATNNAAAAIEILEGIVTDRDKAIQ